jgi:hypothetical protein
MNQTIESNGIQYFDEDYFDFVLNYHGIIGSTYSYNGFQDLKHLYTLNKMFSNRPWGNIIDRSNSTKYPFKLHIRLPWTQPKELDKSLDLETACSIRVNEIIKRYPAPYNLYWSGGIDSTLLIISFMKLVEHKNLIVYLTKNSIKENEYFFENIIKPNLKFAFATGDAPNIGSNITGECGDTIWAALDHSFFLSEPIKSYIYKPWQQWFETKTNDIDFLNFAEKFMKKANRPIVTLFDARWWFYLLCKSQSKATMLQMYAFHNYDAPIIPFYESTDIETWAWYNVENIIKGNDWQTYKWPAKEIIYKFDKNKDYLKNKSKEYSVDLQNANQRKLEINKPLFLTDNFQKPKLSTHPFFSNSVYKIELYEKYKHLFLI